MGDSKPIVRTATAGDFDAVLALWSAERSAHATTADRREDLERLVAETRSVLLVAERDGAVVGALIAAWDGWRGNMYRLAVREDCRRQGIALTLARAGEAHLEAHGARRVTALTAVADEAANAFWAAAGYPLDEAIGRRVRNF